jgi:hypothetical protein
MKKTYVSRSVYQKLAEENKRLLRDLKTITLGKKEDSVIAWLHWREYFKKKDRFWQEVEELLKREAIQYNIQTPKKFN